MIDRPKIEEAILKEVDRLYKEVIDLMSHEPSKEDKEKLIMEILQRAKEGRMEFSSNSFQSTIKEVENIPYCR